MDHILVIEDDRQLCQTLVDYLTAAGFRVEVAHDAGTGLETALAGEHTLLVMAPPPGAQAGFNLLRHLRARCTTPVVLLTSRNEEVDRILGLEMGADDCLSKPFNPRNCSREFTPSCAVCAASRDSSINWRSHPR